VSLACFHAGLYPLFHLHPRQEFEALLYVFLHLIAHLIFPSPIKSVGRTSQSAKTQASSQTVPATRSSRSGLRSQSKLHLDAEVPVSNEVDVIMKQLRNLHLIKAMPDTALNLKTAKDNHENFFLVTKKLNTDFRSPIIRLLSSLLDVWSDSPIVPQKAERQYWEAVPMWTNRLQALMPCDANGERIDLPSDYTEIIWEDWPEACDAIHTLPGRKEMRAANQNFATTSLQ